MSGASAVPAASANLGLEFAAVHRDHGEFDLDFGMDFLEGGCQNEGIVGEGPNLQGAF